MYQTKAFEVAVGFIVLLGVMVLSWIFYIQLKKNDYFNSDCYVVNASFRDVDGIKIGDEVKIFGVKIGSVSSIVLNNDTYSPLLTMCIDKKYYIPVDSSATIASVNFFGKKYVNIFPGNNDEKISKGGSIEYTQSEITLNSLIGKFVNNLLNK